MKRRILASALAVGMVLSLVPAAFAEEVPVTGDQAVARPRQKLHWPKSLLPLPRNLLRHLKL